MLLALIHAASNEMSAGRVDAAGAEPALVATVLVLNAGRIADMFGRARTYTIGFAIFTVASVFCAFAADATQLIAGRVVQGVGGALLMANSAALVTDAIHEKVDRFRGAHLAEVII